VYRLAAPRPQEQGIITQARHLCCFVFGVVKLKNPKKVIITALDPLRELESYRQLAA
jgi:hypothetical protein